MVRAAFTATVVLVVVASTPCWAAVAGRPPPLVQAASARAARAANAADREIADFTRYVSAGTARPLSTFSRRPGQRRPDWSEASVRTRSLSPAGALPFTTSWTT